MKLSRQVILSWVLFESSIIDIENIKSKIKSFSNGEKS